jgi:hypothetical protein
LTDLQKVAKTHFLSFRRKPESSYSNELSNLWTPVFTGVTASYEAVKVEGQNMRNKEFGKELERRISCIGITSNLAMMNASNSLCFHFHRKRQVTGQTLLFFGFLTLDTLGA